MGLHGDRFRAGFDLGAFGKVFWGLSVPCLLALFPSCAPRRESTRQVPQPDLIEQICATESRRHLPSAADQIVFFNNAHMDAYAENPGEPQQLVERIEQSDSLCRGALVQLLARVHCDYVVDEWRMLNVELDAFGKRHLVLGLKDAPSITVGRLAFLLLEPSQPRLVRLEATALLGRLDQAAHLAQIWDVMKRERDPNVLQRLALSLDLDEAPGLLGVLEAQRSRDEIALHEAMLVTVAASGHPQKRDFVGSYAGHDDPKISSMAQSLLVSLESKDRLNLTFSPPPGGALHA